jgi:hypothetical protein
MADPGDDAGAETAALLRRELLQLMTRLSAGPLTLERGLQATVVLRAAMDALQAELVAQARAEGASWAAIAASLGVTTQAAHQRFKPSPIDASTSAAAASPDRTAPSM